MLTVPQSIQKAAQQRLVETLPEQQETIQKIEAGRPLDAEKDETRKVAYIQRQIKCSTAVAKRIAANEDPARLPLNPQQKDKAESLQGDTRDFLPICFLDIGRAASRSVAIVTLANRSPKGTGFMVSPTLFLTNQHVISSREEAKNLFLEFTYELDSDKRTTQVTRFRLDPDTFYINDPEDDLDYALVAIGPKITGPLLHHELGFLPMVDAPDKWITSGFVNIIQHPNGEFKQLVVRENRITSHSDNTLIYGTDTLPGSSGSPVFNDDWEVLALHHWGQPYRAIADLDAAGLPVPVTGNEGIRLSAIIRELIEKLTTLPSPRQQQLLSEALNPGFRHPSLAVSQPVQAESTVSLPPISQPPIPETILPKPTETMATDSNIGNGTFSVTVPLTISLSFGQAESLSKSIPTVVNKIPAAPCGEGPEAVVFKPDPTYSNRKGYDPSFLGVVLPMPEMTAEQRQQSAKNQQATNDNPNEFPYQNFSLVMNRLRRLPFFTAVNIDGSSVVHINRKTGKVTSSESLTAEGAEAREVWYDDPRILPAETTQDSLYRTAEFSIFQRGHLVKRTDPSWGTPERAYKGQSDTFHFTNCSPQHQLFNPITTRWAGIEDWITRVSDEENIRITVFSGPIFDKNDPTISGLAIPRQFWKVVVWVDKGKIQSTSLIADQSDLLPRTSGEGLNNPEADPKNKFPKSYHVALETVEKETGLNFGDAVRQGDSFPKGGENIGKRTEFDTFDYLQPFIFPGNND